ncbi:hypothetical protein [Acetivibrio clariflavus]|nr:hypothetical protein [Acetivibrio clariflavus]HPU42286.1 hypothetical protein [Acetivibrio clariflavus]
MNLTLMPKKLYPMEEHLGLLLNAEDNKSTFCMLESFGMANGTVYS